MWKNIDMFILIDFMVLIVKQKNGGMVILFYDDNINNIIYIDTNV